MLNLDQPRRGGLLLTIAAGIAIGVSVNFVSTALAGPAGVEDSNRGL